MRNATILALLTLVVLIAVACSGDADDLSPSATSTALPAEDATAEADVSSKFPVVLESETLVVASADGSGITETPLEPGERALFGGADVGSPDGRYTALIRDGGLLIQEGDGEPVPIPDIPSASSYQYGAWSPDSSRMLFSVSSDEAPMDVYVINADGSGLTALSEGLSGTTFFLVWSADGARVAFSLWPAEASAAQMYVTRADGTERTLLGEYVPPQGDGGWDLPAWSPDGARIVAVHGGGLRIFDIAGGTVRDFPETSGTKFSWSPDGRFLAFDSWNGGTSTTVVKVVDVTASAEPRLLVEGRHPRWSPDGELIAFKRGGVHTIRPDGTDEVVLAAGGPAYFGDLTWSEDSRGVEWVREAPSVQHLYAIDLRDGAVVRTPASLTEAGLYEGPRDIDLAPNARQISFQVSADKEGQFAPGWYTMDVDTGELTRVADEPLDGDVYWSSEGLRIAYSAGIGGVYVTDSDGSAPRQVSDAETLGPMSWSPDGRSLAFLPFPDGADLHIVDVETTDVTTIAADFNDESDSIAALEWSPDGSQVLYEVAHQTPTGMARETFLADLDGSPPVTLLAAEAMAAEATWSPDGETIAYVLGDDGTEVWLMNAEGGDQRFLTSFESNFRVSQLRWSPDGASIAVVVGSSDVYVIDVETGSSLIVATNSTYCRVNLLGWSPDSQRIFVVPSCEFQAGH